MSDSVVKGINQRRKHVLVLLMKYLVNGNVPNTDLIRRKTITKSSLHVKAIAMYAKLFENDSVGCEKLT